MTSKSQQTTEIMEPVWFGQYQMNRIIDLTKSIVALVTRGEEEFVAKACLKSRFNQLRHERETNILRKINLESVARLIDSFSSDQHYVLIFPYYGDKTLLDIVVDNKYLMRSQSHINFILRILISVCQVVSDLHNLDVVHRDLKPENILLISDHELDPKIMLIDFDLAADVSVKDHPTMVKGACGTLGFIAPEVLFLSDNNCNVSEKEIDYKKADIYSIGIIAYYLFNEEIYPYPIERLEDAIYAFHYQSPRSSQYPYNRRINSIIMSMINVNPLLRPSLDNIISDFTSLIVPTSENLPEPH
jgi:serine/threonine protein kinase